MPLPQKPYIPALKYEVLGLILDKNIKHIAFSSISSLIRRHLIPCHDPDSFSGSTLWDVDSSRFIPRAHHESNLEKEHIVVPGNFDLPHANLEHFLSMPDEAQNNTVIVTKFIPLKLLGACLKSRAIVLTQGSHLSHAAITCQEKEHPLKILK